jgi:hypothetical protein
LRARGPSDAVDELRDRLAAVKPELIELLTREQRVGELRAMLQDVRQQLTSTSDRWPAGGVATLARLAPELATELTAVEVEVDQLACSHVAGGRRLAAYREALERWRDMVLAAEARLSAMCHDCGRQTTVALVDPADGSRYCPRCARPTESSIAELQLVRRVLPGGGS